MKTQSAEAGQEKLARKVPLKAFRKMVKSAGMRMTRQRRMLYRELAGRSDHPDVEQLYAAVKSRIPRLSLFTVYRTMNRLEEMGVVVRVATWTGHARFDGHVHAHAHFLCETCGRIMDVEGVDVEALVKQMAGMGGRVHRVCVTFHGTGPLCAHWEREATAGEAGDAALSRAVANATCVCSDRAMGESCAY